MSPLRRENGFDRGEGGTHGFRVRFTEIPSSFPRRRIQSDEGWGVGGLGCFTYHSPICFMHDHENIREDEHPEIVAHNTRLGLMLFAIYCLLYGGFMGLSTFAPEVMRWQPFGGINLAILYGFGLIAAAMILAAVYLVLARREVSGGKGK